MSWVVDEADTPASLRPVVVDDEMEALPVSEAAGTTRMAEPSAEERAAALTAQAQRLAELHEELHQLEQMPTLSGGSLESGGDLIAGSMPPLWYDRIAEIECEIEQLREEMSAGEAPPSSSHPRAAEEIGRRILHQTDFSTGNLLR